MKKSTKRNLIEYSIILSIFGGLYITGLHTEVLGFIQRGVLATGLMDPSIQNYDDSLVSQATYPKADYSMKLINAKGEMVEMESFRGKVIFLNIWASWCPPCLAEMPGINKLFNALDEDKVAFIMLSVDDDFTKAIKLYKKKGYDFDIYQVPNGLPSLYYTQSIPTTFVINADGKLVLTHSGMGDFDTQEFKAYLKTLE
jgi:thiol-disulfide isomerase/thioredoxin